jgi:hypothetical protein
MRNSRWLFALLLVVAAFAGGCATPAVWGVKERHAAMDPHLGVAFAPNNYDFLVKYDEQGDKARTIQPRSYWLFAYADNPPKKFRPNFVDSTKLTDLVTVPVIANNREPVPESGYCARLTDDQNGLDLYRNGVDLGRFLLPAYSSSPQPATVSRVMLTPPAVIADTVIVGTVVGIYTSPYWLQALQAVGH